MHKLSIPTSKTTEVLDITDAVLSAIKADDAKMALVHIPHTTAAIMINEFEPNIKIDFETLYSTLVPDSDYLHEHVDSNAKAHLTASLIGNSATFPINKGKAALGVWQRIILVELDGPREREVYIQVI